MPHHEEAKDLKVILIFPGLGGSSDRMYIKYLVNYLTNFDSRYLVGVIHTRGSGYTELKTPKFTDNTSVSDDWEEALDFISTKFDSKS